MTEQIESCRCNFINQNKFNTSIEHDRSIGMELDDVFKDNSLIKEDKNYESLDLSHNKITNEVTIPTNIKAKAKNIAQTTPMNILRSLLNKKQDSEKKIIEVEKTELIATPIAKADNYMAFIKYQTVESIDQDNSQNHEEQCSQNFDNYNSNKSCRTNLDEYELDRDIRANYDYEVGRSKLDLKEEINDYSSNLSKSPIKEEENKNNASIFGTNYYSKYYQKVKPGVNRRDTYAAETEDNITQDELLIERNETNNQNKIDQNKSVDLEYSYSYGQTNLVFNTVDEDHIPHKKNSTFSNIEFLTKLSQRKSEANITLGSICVDGNEHKNENEYLQKYSPDTEMILEYNNDKNEVEEEEFIPK